MIIVNDYIIKVAKILDRFSFSGDATVKLEFCEKRVLQRIKKVLELIKKENRSKDIIISVLQIIRNLAMEIKTPAIPEALADAGYIELLLTFVDNSQISHVIHTVYNICYLNAHRGEIAVINGIVPILQRVITDPLVQMLKEFALPMLCTLPITAATRPILWENNTLSFYLNLLQDKSWNADALKIIAQWAEADSELISNVLLRESNISLLVGVFDMNQNRSQLESFLNIITQLEAVSEILAETAELYKVIVAKIADPKTEAEIEISLLHILDTLLAANYNPKAVVRQHKLKSILKNVATSTDSKVAEKLATMMLQKYCGDR